MRDGIDACSSASAPSCFRAADQRTRKRGLQALAGDDVGHLDELELAALGVPLEDVLALGSRPDSTADGPAGGEEL